MTVSAGTRTLSASTAHASLPYWRGVLAMGEGEVDICSKPMRCASGRITELEPFIPKRSIMMMIDGSSPFWQPRSMNLARNRP